MNITRISDLLSGKKVWKYYCDYNESQWFSKSELDEIKLLKFRKLVEHIYLHVPFYRNYMKNVGMVPSDINSLDRISDFPIITKDIIKNNYKDFIPNNLSKISGVKTGQTGGTTGNILFKRTDANTRSSIWGAFKRFEDWMDYKTGDPALILMGGHVIHKNDISHNIGKLKKELTYKILNQVVLNPYETSSESIKKIIDALENKKYRLIRGYSQYMFNLCNILKSKNMNFHIPSITTTAEPLMQIHRNIFKEILGADSFDQYGCGEIGGIAFECEKHEGLHITEERVIVEVQGNTDLIMTDLDNYAMPFIRYWNADQAVLSDEKCSCGREHRLIKKILGRTCDYVTGINGQFLHWAYFWHLVFDSGISDKRNLSKFQIVQKSKSELIFHYVADELSSSEKNTMRKNIQHRLGDVSVVFSREKEIANSRSGKYRPVINDMIKSQGN